MITPKDATTSTITATTTQLGMKSNRTISLVNLGAELRPSV
jgi:hypothetical protein